MIDIFLQKDAVDLLKNKNVVFMGDSNIRALYKDTLCLLNQSKLVSQKVLQKKGENSCYGDQLLFMGHRYNGREYREERKGSGGKTMLSFYFLTRVYDKYVKQIVKDLSKDKQNQPDILVVNSCLWDVTRWGPDGVKCYKKNLVLLMEDLKKQLPDCLIIWVTAPPIACDPSGGFLVKEIEFLKYSIRFHVVEANHYARKVVVDNGFDVVDSHYHLKLQIHRRTLDGIHWFPEAVRYVTNLLLTHISIAWNVPLPHRFKSDSVEENSALISEEEDTDEQKISQVSSVIVAPKDIVICTPVKQIENKKKKQRIFDTPPGLKRMKKKKKKPLIERNGKVEESHHSFIKRVEYKERHERIRRWQKPVEPRNLSENYQQYSAHCPSYNNQDHGCYSPLNNSTYTHQGFTDNSRYMTIPSKPYQQPRKIILCSPVNHASYDTYDQQRYIGDPRCTLLVPNSYQQPHNAILSAPINHVSYNYHTYIDRPRHMPPYGSPLIEYTTNTRSPPHDYGSFLRNMQVSPLASFPSKPHHNPYIPDVSNWVQSQPQINFAATDCMPFGVQF